MKIKFLFDNETLKTFEEINKGWSLDKKYFIQTDNYQEFLMRTSPIETFDRKRIEFKKMKDILSLGIPMSTPLDLNIHEEVVQSLFTWVEGNDAEEVLPKLKKEKQYKLGYQSGKILKKIHSLPAPQNAMLWEESYGQKIDRNIKNYLNCELNYENDHLFLTYINENRQLIKNRPLTFQHGDYHTGNMILNSANKLSIIDFNRWSYGDPWEEFNRIDFTAKVSPIFATGQINGYFANNPPIEFFKLMALYISVNTLNALPWAQSYSDKEVKTMKKKAAEVLKWFDGMEEVVPNWYERNAQEKYDKK